MSSPYAESIVILAEIIDASFGAIFAYSAVQSIIIPYWYFSGIFFHAPDSVNPKIARICAYAVPSPQSKIGIAGGDF